MTTLFAVYNSKGKCISYCNSKCYNAKLPSEVSDSHSKDFCTCCCGGRNHAAGEIRALKNYQAGIGMQPDDLKRFAQARHLECEALTVVDRLHVSMRQVRKRVHAHFNPKPLPLFAYGRLDGRKPVKGAQRRGTKSPSPLPTPSLRTSTSER